VSILKYICIAALALSSFAISTSVRAQTRLNLGDALIVLNTDDKRYWQMDTANAPLRRPLYPADLLRADVSGCVSIGFFIEPDGTTSGYRILKSSLLSGKLSAKQKRVALAMFSKSALGSLVTARFVVGPENPSKQRGFSQMPYSFATSANQDKMFGKCNIADLAVFLKSAEVEEVR